MTSPRTARVINTVGYSPMDYKFFIPYFGKYCCLTKRVAVNSIGPSDQSPRTKLLKAHGKQTLPDRIFCRTSQSVSANFYIQFTCSNTPDFQPQAIMLSECTAVLAIVDMYSRHAIYHLFISPSSSTYEQLSVFNYYIDKFH
jgi:hypothetical protein